jgi:hypothetical protein
MAKRFLAALPLLAGMAACAIAQESDQPLANAKVGDWAVYTTTSAQFKSTMREEVVAIKGKLVTVKFTSTVNGIDLPASEQTFDVSKKVDPNAGVDKADNLKIKETGVGKETLKVNGKDYVCDWRANHIIATANGQEIVSESKVWISKDGPLFGMVKTETRASGILTMMELTESGTKK